MKLRILLCVCMLILSGCVENSIVDDIQMVTVIGYEKTDDGKLKGIAVAPQFQANGNVENSVFVETAQISKEIRSQFNTESPKPLVSGKLQLAIYSKKIAEEDGIMELTDTLQRDPSIGSRTFLAVSNSDPEAMLRTNFGNVDTGHYIHSILEHNSKYGMLPETNLHNFFYYYFSEGNDPFLPLIDLEEDKVKITGLVLLKKDKMVSELPADDLFTFKILYENFSSNDSYTTDLGGGDHASIYNIASKRDIDLKKIKKNKITINGKVLGVIKEYTGEELNTKVKEKIEKDMEEEVEKKGREMIEKFQEEGIDPLGLGNAVRSVTRGKFDYDEWKQRYTDIDIKFNMEVVITESGVIE
ncbi:Ger(x)C family spore germination protein [Guptibacillus algicola]|uniref:Ger(x)C family spore germination protein n=1 Tax=Guptibacillus algicola TaxID=225844 RepID=UPI001CD5FF48|nr:Ger(x)C family spore germination protein [Alkalihalobacillus algicola]MCA0989071.1 Ger(x)C family spore germination protein [Alkalihalobacillus algicola]